MWPFSNHKHIFNELLQWGNYTDDDGDDIGESYVRLRCYKCKKNININLKIYIKKDQPVWVQIERYLCMPDNFIKTKGYKGYTND